LGCPTEEIERVWFNPSNSKRNWQTLGLWNCNESIDDQLWDCLGPIHLEMKEIMRNGIDIALSTSQEVTIGINIRDINQDKKMMDNLHLLNTSRRHGCAHCNKKWEDYWSTMGTSTTTRPDEEMSFLRMDHESAILQGESNFTANDASGGNDSRPRLAVVDRSLTIGLVHLIISIGHMFFKMFLLLEHGGTLANITNEHGKQLKTKFMKKFLLLSIALSLNFSAKATNYFVSNSGEECCQLCSEAVVVGRIVGIHRPGICILNLKKIHQTVPKIICDERTNERTDKGESIGPFGLQPGTN
jgi:hypothetical protein